MKDFLSTQEKLLFNNIFFKKIFWKNLSANRKTLYKCCFFWHLKNKKEIVFFISMPPFRSLWLFLIPSLKILLDIRDGWSIAQESGYGDNVRKRPFKAKVTRLVERFIIRRAYVTITCTNGLQEYLQKVSGKEILLIPNGVLESDYELAQRLTAEVTDKCNNDQLVFCCAGQFSEYGVEKVKKLCHVIIDRYQMRNIKIQLIGSSEEKNRWLKSFLPKISESRAAVEFLPRMGRAELYETMTQADYGLTILRDPAYEFGTKVYDYIALGLPVVNYFDEPNNFTRYFDACLDKPFDETAEVPEIRRSKLIERELNTAEL